MKIRDAHRRLGQTREEPWKIGDATLQSRKTRNRGLRGGFSDGPVRIPGPDKGPRFRPVGEREVGPAGFFLAARLGKRGRGLLRGLLPHERAGVMEESAAGSRRRVAPSLSKRACPCLTVPGPRFPAARRPGGRARRDPRSRSTAFPDRRALQRCSHPKADCPSMRPRGASKSSAPTARRNRGGCRSSCGFSRISTMSFSMS